MILVLSVTGSLLVRRDKEAKKWSMDSIQRVEFLPMHVLEGGERDVVHVDYHGAISGSSSYPWSHGLVLPVWGQAQICDQLMGAETADYKGA
jgi:hypothetical protein